MTEHPRRPLPARSLATSIVTPLALVAALLLVAPAAAQPSAVPDGMRYVMTGALAEYDGSATTPSLTAVPVRRGADGGWSYVGDLDAALRGEPSDLPDAACLVQFGARVGTADDGGDPEPSIVFSGIVPGGLRPGAVYPVVAEGDAAAAAGQGLYGREWAHPGAFLVRVADLVPTDGMPVYTVYRGAAGSVRVVAATPERVELAFSAALAQTVPAPDVADGDAAGDAAVAPAVQLAGTFAQEHRRGPLEVAPTVEALAGEVTGDWYLCGGPGPVLAEAEPDSEPSSDDAQLEVAAAGAAVPPRAPTPSPTEPKDTPAGKSLPGAPAPDAAARAAADGADDASLATLGPSLPATCAGMPRYVWAGLVASDAVDIVVDAVDGACRIAFERPDPQGDARWWRRSGISHVAIPGEDGVVTFRVFGGGLRGEGTLEAGPPDRVVWTVESD
jgi:hypothetical protein